MISAPNPKSTVIFDVFEIQLVMFSKRKLAHGFTGVGAEEAQIPLNQKSAGIQFDMMVCAKTEEIL